VLPPVNGVDAVAQTGDLIPPKMSYDRPIWASAGEYKTAQLQNRRETNVE